MTTLPDDSPKIAIIGLGYVGLPLALEFGKKFQCTGFDTNKERVNSLRSGIDHSNEFSQHDISLAHKLTFSSDPAAVKNSNIYIIAVPTPIDSNKQPDLKPLESASMLIGTMLAKSDIVIYESTVYPGCTEEICIPILEQQSRLTLNVEFFVGYSPERINPGDQTHKLANIVKITSGSTEEAADYIDWLYRQIITAGTHKAASIKVAEAAKVVENTQRDVNIALMNELALIFQRLQIDSEDVLTAASTKWNFLPFRPGLVGGHCIGVDPYYLVHKAELAGYHPEIISASRRINDGMGTIVANRVMHLMTQKRIHIVDANILILGLSFKENCRDLRNTRVADIITELKLCNAYVDVFDPCVDTIEAENEFGIHLIEEPPNGGYDAVIIAVAHTVFKELGINAIRQWLKPDGIVFDIKYLFPANQVDGRL